MSLCNYLKNVKGLNKTLQKRAKKLDQNLFVVLGLEMTELITKDKFFLMLYWIEKKYSISISPFTATPTFLLSDLMQCIWQKKNIYI